MACISSGSCPICLVPLKNCEDLEHVAERRTPASTAAQLLRQRRHGAKGGDEACVKNVRNFTSSHKYTDIYQGMMVDILHQLLKGVLMHVLKWTMATD